MPLPSLKVICPIGQIKKLKRGYLGHVTNTSTALLNFWHWSPTDDTFHNVETPTCSSVWHQNVKITLNVNVTKLSKMSLRKQKCFERVNITVSIWSPRCNISFKLSFKPLLCIYIVRTYKIKFHVSLIYVLVSCHSIAPIFRCIYISCFNTYLQTHKSQSLCNLYRYLVDNPSVLSLANELVLLLDPFWKKINMINWLCLYI